MPNSSTRLTVLWYSQLAPSGKEHGSLFCRPGRTPKWDGIASLGHGGVCGPKLPTLVLELDENIRDLTERQAVNVAQKIIYKQADLLYKSEKMKK
jgi:hypothetical protein